MIMSHDKHPLSDIITMKNFPVSQTKNFIDTRFINRNKVKSYAVLINIFVAFFSNKICLISFQSGKNAPYYVGAAQTLPRGMYSDRNKNSVGK